MRQMAETKLCTVIIPAYNMCKYRDKALSSIFANKNNEKYLDILVVNDGSSDQIISKINELQKNHKNLYLHNKGNGNWGSVINYVKHNKLVNSKYAFVLDGDDWIKKNFVNALIQITRKKDFDLIAFNLTVIYHKNLRINIDPNLLSKKSNKPIIPMLVPCGIVFKTELFYETSDLVEKASYQDYPMYIQLIEKAQSIKLSSRSVSVYWYSRPGNTMSSEWNAKRIADEKTLFDELEKINKGYTFIFRLSLPNYVQNLKTSGCVLKINKSDYLNEIKKSSLFYKTVMNYCIKKALKLKCLEWVESKNMFEVKSN